MSTTKRPRGNPNFFMKRAAREGVDVSELIKQSLARAHKPKKLLKVHEAAHLVDKNSKTIVKIVQLLVSV
jgi:hypothetical protein